MKIAIMAPLVTAIREPQLGGSQAFVSDLARGLVGRGHEVHVYAAAGSQIPGVTVVDTGTDPRALAGTLYRAVVPAGAGPAGTGPAGTGPAGTGPAGTGPAGTAVASAPPGADTGESARAASQAAFAGAYAMMRDVGYDVIHNHAFDVPAVRLATTMPAPVLHTLHLPPDATLIAALDQAAHSARPPVVATVSAFQAAAWRRVVRVDEVVPPYVPTRAIPYSVTAGNGAVFAGRLSPEKGAAEAIDIAAAAGLSIDVYGDAYDEGYARDQIAPRQAGPGVRIHEAVPRAVLWATMSRAAVVVNPVQWDEPFGMVAAEAQACGTPVVAFRRGGLTEIIEDGVTGFLVSPGDLQAAARAAGQAAAISRIACRRRAERHLDLEQSLDTHERIYRQMIATSSAEGWQ
jgi:glycosyltransferase involved in cell wall biosynthesis